MCLFPFLTVMVPAYEPKGTKKNYSRADYCYFCKKFLLSRISSHYVRAHATEEIVKNILRLEGKRKAVQLYKLQQLGNFHYNCHVRMHILTLHSNKPFICFNCFFQIWKFPTLRQRRHLQYWGCCLWLCCWLGLACYCAHDPCH